jgi:hypothetical protein
MASEMWYEVVDGQYSCKECNQPMVRVAIKEASTGATEADCYRCDGCNKSVVVPPNPK